MLAVVVVGIIIAVSASHSGGAGSSTAEFSVRQACSDWAQIADGLGNKTATEADVLSKIASMKTHADVAAGLDVKYQDFSVAVGQLRVALTAGDSGDVDAPAGTIKAVCSVGH